MPALVEGCDIFSYLSVLRRPVLTRARLRLDDDVRFEPHACDGVLDCRFPVNVSPKHPLNHFRPKPRFCRFSHYRTIFLFPTEGKVAVPLAIDDLPVDLDEALIAGESTVFDRVRGKLMQGF